MNYTDEWLFICDDCNETFVHPNGIAMHARDMLIRDVGHGLPPEQMEKQANQHTGWRVYRRADPPVTN